LVASHVIDTENVAVGLPFILGELYPAMFSDEEPLELIGARPLLETPVTTAVTYLGNPKLPDAHNFSRVNSACVPIHCDSLQLTASDHENESAQSPMPTISDNSTIPKAGSNDCAIPRTGGVPKFTPDVSTIILGNVKGAVSTEPRKPVALPAEYSCQSSAVTVTVIAFMLSGRHERLAQQYHPAVGAQQLQLSAMLPLLTISDPFFVASGIRCRP
jgi:hypothetical protein